MQKHKINEALNQNTNSNHNFKTNQIRKKKKKKKRKIKADPSEPRWGGHAVVGGEKRDPSDPFVCERELLECSGVDEVLEKKRKKKSEKRRNARKEKKKE